MIEVAAITAIVISSLTALASCLVALKIKKMKSGCLECETEEQRIIKHNSLKHSEASTSV